MLRKGKHADFFEENYKVIVFILLAAFALQVLNAIQTFSPTFDERIHLNSAHRHLTTGKADWILEQPPMRSLSAVPLLFYGLPSPKTATEDIYGGEWEYYLKKARLMTLLFGLLLGFTIFLWTKELFGIKGGLLALLLYSFEPNIIAHSSLVTTDLSAACWIFVATYAFYKFTQRGTVKHALLSGLTLGCAFIAKFTALMLLPIFAVLGIVCIKSKPKIKYLLLLLSIPLIALLIINAAFLFKGSFKPTIESSDIVPGKIKDFHNGILKSIPLPIPGWYHEGLRQLKAHSNKHFLAPYLLGEFNPTGWWYYFIVGILVKTPIPLLMLFFLSFIFIAKEKQWKAAAFLLTPVLFLLSLASFANNINIGIRHILPVYPFIIVLAGATILLLTSARAKAILYILLTWYVVSTILIAPHYLSYFNEFTGGPKYGYKYMIDSNLDWGQSSHSLKEYIKNSDVPITHPDPGCEYTSGRIAIAANNLVDFWSQNPECHAWLREFEPIDSVGAFIVFDVPERNQTI